MPGPPSIKQYALLAIALVFTVGGAAMVFSGAEHGWPVLLFFGLCTAVFIGQMLQGRLHGSASPESLLQRFPGPIELSAGRLKFLLLMVGAAIFGGVSWWYLQHERLGWYATIVLWLAVIGCIAAVPLMIALMLRGSSLRLDASHLHARHGWRRQPTRWADTSAFEAATVPGTDVRLVIYDDATKGKSPLGVMNAGLMGRNAAVPDSYGLTPKELAWLLNGWRERALALPDRKPQGFGRRRRQW